MKVKAAKVDRTNDTRIFIEACRWFETKGGAAPEIGQKAIPDELLRLDTEEYRDRRNK